MKNATSDASIQSGGRNDNYNSIVSDLASLIAQVQASMMSIETAIVGELTLGHQEICANVVVLDDVTPRYVNANAALNTCRAGLGAALHFLMDDETAKRGASECGLPGYLSSAIGATSCHVRETGQARAFRCGSMSPVTHVAGVTGQAVELAVVARHGAVGAAATLDGNISTRSFGRPALSATTADAENQESGRPERNVVPVQVSDC